MCDQIALSSQNPFPDLSLNDGRRESALRDLRSQIIRNSRNSLASGELATQSLLGGRRSGLAKTLGFSPETLLFKSQKNFLQRRAPAPNLGTV